MSHLHSPSHNYKTIDHQAIASAILNNPYLPIAYLDTDFNYRSVNEIFAKACEKDTHFFDKKNHFDLYPNQHIKAIFTDALHTKKAHYSNTALFTEPEHQKTESPNWDWSLVPVSDAQNNTLGFLLTLFDTSKHIEADKSLQRVNRALQTISAANECLVTARNDKAFLNEICRIIVEIGGYRMAWVGYPGQDQRKTVIPIAHYGFEEGYLKSINISWEANETGNGPTGTAIRTGQPTMAKNITTDENYSPWRKQASNRGYASSIALPLLHDGKTLGAINIYSDIADAFTLEEQKLLTDLADDIAFGIVALRTKTEHTEIEAQIRHSEQELRAILDSMQDTCYQVDKNGTVTRVSSAVHQLIGFTPEEIIGTRLADLYVDPQGREKFLRALTKSGGQISNYEAQLRCKSGKIIWVSTNAHFNLNKQGQVIGIEGTTRDVTERRQSETLMRELSAALEQTADSVSIISLDGTIEFVNASYETTTGYSKEEAIGQNARLLKSGKHDKPFYQDMWKTILEGKVFFDVFINRKKDGSLYYEETSISPLKNEDGAILKFISVGKDITERMETQQRLHYLAHHDVLTSLPNRALFLDRLNHALRRTTDKNEKLAVLFLDVDRFKVINDTLGHDIGDRVLTDLANRLDQCVYQGDTIARLSGDEFAIIIENLAHTDQATNLARAILNELSEPFIIDSHTLFVTTSIGISVSPIDGIDSQTLLKHADIAMYRAKDKGRNTYQYYSADMSTRALERLSLETHLRYALERDEFSLIYQPQMDALTGELIGVEALLRWYHPDLGLIMPTDFIPILEETGLIPQVGDWVINNACEQVAFWHQKYNTRFRLSVNISARHFSNPNLVSTINAALINTGLDPSLLEVEITESVIMRDDQWVRMAFQALKEMNIRIAIDDFGTEYSSLNYLKRFPVSTLKIDRSFVRDITTDPDDAAIVKAIIAMGKSLKLQVIAEGVENEEQLDFLIQHNCDLVQGYLFNLPDHFKPTTPPCKKK